MNLTVSRAGFLTNIQDLGRPGFREFGVPLGGALDSHALRVANLLVGNVETDAGLEITFGGVQLRFPDDRVVAWCGGEFDVRIGKEPLSAGHAGLVRADESVAIGAPKMGSRAWVAISGGIDVPVVLGSRSTDWRARMGGIEGRALRDGDRLSLGAPSDASLALVKALATDGPSSWSSNRAWVATAQKNPVLRFVRGVDWIRFEGAAGDAFAGESFKVARDSNRMGARLEGTALMRRDDVDLISEAVAPGTIQVPPNGQPIILLGDCQTIGGYPKFAHVITVDLPVAAQLCAGNEVRFREVSLAEAHRLLSERERDFICFRTGLSLRVS